MYVSRCYILCSLHIIVIVSHITPDTVYRSLIKMFLDLFVYWFIYWHSISCRGYVLLNDRLVTCEWLWSLLTFIHTQHKIVYQKGLCELFKCLKLNNSHLETFFYKFLHPCNFLKCVKWPTLSNMWEEWSVPAKRSWWVGVSTQVVT